MSKAGIIPPAWWWLMVVSICLLISPFWAVAAVIDATCRASSILYWAIRRRPR